MDYPFTIHRNLRASGEEWKDLFVRSPSNIALVKYWGKHGNQMPSNPSLSITLSHSFTELRLFWKKRVTAAESRLELLFEGESRPSFEGRIHRYLEKISPLMPWLDQLSLRVETRNTFPHSAGIASCSCLN